MTASVHKPAPATPSAQLDACLKELAQGRQRYARTSIDARIRLAQQCAEGVWRTARQWVDAACTAKGIPPGSPARAEEILAGPVATLRYLRLLTGSLADIAVGGRPRLPGKPRLDPDGRLRVPLVPARGLYDGLAFFPLAVTARMQEGINQENLAEHLAIPFRPENVGRTRVALVLGAGNVSSIAATDALSKLFQEGSVVLLKMSPVNEYLGPIFQEALAPLVADGYLRIIYGDAAIGAAAIQHELVDAVHITGSIESHDTIVWGPPGPDRQARKQAGQPLLTKPITSELGNVTPWIVVPGEYSGRQLAYQAENLVASVANNASFNCIATKVVLTWKRWAQREQFLDLLQAKLRQTPRRAAYYPGAADRYRRFAPGDPAEPADGTLPWTLLRNVPPEPGSPCFQEESFVCVFVETALDAAGPEQFLDRAVDFANEHLWGTLAATVTLPPGFQRGGAGKRLVQSCLGRLRYGSIGVNHWPGLIYAMMSPPWGGYPGSSLADAQSGIGTVHNTSMLDGVEKTVLEGPLTTPYTPLWFPSHPCPERAAWALLDLYRTPSIWHLARLLASAIRIRF